MSPRGHSKLGHGRSSPFRRILLVSLCTHHCPPLLGGRTPKTSETPGSGCQSPEESIVQLQGTDTLPGPCTSTCPLCTDYDLYVDGFCFLCYKSMGLEGATPTDGPPPTHRPGGRATWGSEWKTLHSTQTPGSWPVFSSEEPWLPRKASHVPWKPGLILLLFPSKGFLRRMGAEQLRTAWELEQASCTHNSPVSAVLTQFPGSQWGPLPSHSRV